jgi:hypothetical protein
MNSPACNGLYTGSWKDLYHAAICEPDLNRLPDRIAAAEAAVAVCLRELSYATDDNAEEAESMEDAMYILHAFRSSLERRTIGCDVLKSSPLQGNVIANGDRVAPGAVHSVTRLAC